MVLDLSIFSFVCVGGRFQMGDGAAPSRYVKLTKDQAPLEDIKPGELNQPVEVPQVFLEFFLPLLL